MKSGLIGVVVGLLIAAVICAWRGLPPPGSSTPAPEARELRGESTERVECKPVLVYRDRIKQELGLPGPVQQDLAKRVVGAVRVPGLDRPQTVSAVFDTGSGAVDMFIRKDPLPWVSLDRRYSVGLYYGARDEKGAAWRAIGEARLLRVKALDGVLHGQIDDDGRRFAGVGIRADFR